MYHVGRPGHELIYIERVLQAWGVDGHNSHTNVCSASARAGLRPLARARPALARSRNARFILLLSSHLEAGHYFNPHAQRIIDGKMAGAKICVMDTRLSEHRVDGRLLAPALAGHARPRCCWPSCTACCAKARGTASSSAAG